MGNKVKITKLKSPVPKDQNETIIEFTLEMNELFMKEIYPFMEIEVMQGKKELTPDGIKYTFVLDDEKAKIFREALMKVVFKTTDN